MSTGLARQRISTLLFYSTVLLLAYLLYLLFSPFLTPLAWAAILAALFHSPFRRLEARWGSARAAAFSTAGVTLVIVVPLVLVTMAFIQEATLAVGSADLSVQSEGFQRLQRIWKLAWLWHASPIDQHRNNWNVAGKRRPNFDHDEVFRIDEPSLPVFVLRSQPVWTDDGQHGIAYSYLALQVALEVFPDRNVVNIHKELIAAERRGQRIVQPAGYMA